MFCTHQNILKYPTKKYGLEGCKKISMPMATSTLIVTYQGVFIFSSIFSFLDTLPKRSVLIGFGTCVFIVVACCNVWVFVYPCVCVIALIASVCVCVCKCVCVCVCLLVEKFLTIVREWT